MEYPLRVQETVKSSNSTMKS